VKLLSAFLKVETAAVQRFGLEIDMVRTVRIALFTVMPPFEPKPDEPVWAA
jgi:hypothetical protein